MQTDFIKVCPSCNEPQPQSEFSPNERRCKACMRAKANAYRLAHPDRCKDQYKAWARTHSDVRRAVNRRFKDKNPDYFSDYTKSRPEITKENNKSAELTLRYSVLSYYSNGVPQCLWCGNQNFCVLDIDHVKDDGNIHRKSDKTAAKRLDLWIKRHGYPEGFQVLCKNCNWAKRRGRVYVNGRYEPKSSVLTVEQELISQ